MRNTSGVLRQLTPAEEEDRDHSDFQTDDPPPGKENEFELFLRGTALPLVVQQSGLIAQHVGKPRDPSSTEYAYVTIWDEGAFAGEGWQEAVITPDEQHLLKETSIRHYQVMPTRHR